MIFELFGFCRVGAKGGGPKGGGPKGGGPEGWGPRRVGAPKGGGPEGWGPRRVGAPKGGGPEGWGPRRVGAPKGGAPEGWGPRRVEHPKGGAPEGWRVEPPKGGAPEGWSPRRVEPPKGGAPKGGAQKGGAQKGGAQKGGAQKGGAQKGGEAQNFALFFPSPPQFSFFFFSLGVFSWNFGGVFEAPGPLCTFGVLGLSCASPGGGRRAIRRRVVRGLGFSSSCAARKGPIPSCPSQVAGEVGGRWSEETATFLRLLAAALLQRRAEQAWRMWWEGCWRALQPAPSLLPCWNSAPMWVEMPIHPCSVTSCQSSATLVLELRKKRTNFAAGE